MAAQPFFHIVIYRLSYWTISIYSDTILVDTTFLFLSDDFCDKDLQSYFKEKTISGQLSDAHCATIKPQVSGEWAMGGW
jgi:hypothetical protein